MRRRRARIPTSTLWCFVCVVATAAAVAAVSIAGIGLGRPGLLENGRIWRASRRLSSVSGICGAARTGCRVYGELPTETENSSKLRVGIIGGGIGGLATALALRSYCPEKIAHIDIFEKRERNADFGKGTGLMLWKNGLKVLQQIDEVQSLGVFDSMIKNSVKLMGTEMDSFGDKKSLRVDSGMVGIQWSAFHKTLHDGIKNWDDGSITLHYDHACRDIANLKDVDKVQITFESRDGEEMKEIMCEYDLVVAADGINSRIRSKLFDDTPPVPQGRAIFRAVIENSKAEDASKGGDIKLPPNKDDQTLMCLRDPKKIVAFLPVSNEATYWAATIHKDANERLAKDGAEAKELLLSAEYEMYPELQKMVELTPPEKIFYNHLKQLEPLATWVNRRVVLMGDAAHAMIPAAGQGVGMAVEDAQQLAVSLAGCKNIDDALNHYETVRIPRVTQVQIQNAQDARDSYVKFKKTSKLDREEYNRFLFGYPGATDPS
mmetsp:Transcript_13674/g.21842  ORF Transcript_13674/g.21842 Transcript_13674/m.21842 type:complete len:490 (-) Transcript_13674:152-1621(-)